MKNLNLIAFGIVCAITGAVLVGATSCRTPDQEIQVLKTTIDSCEYLYSDQFIVHKGNCSNPIHLK